MNPTRFFETIDLRLTPLSPVHIGCGVDFEPTNYVVDEGVLFHFDPSRVKLDALDRDRLIKAADGGPDALPRIQAFFHERRDRFAAAATIAVPLAAGVAAQHAARIGQIAQREQGGRQVNNQLQIERTAHHPHNGAPLIPGSSLKGSMRTAWLDHLNRGRGREQGEKSPQLEKRLLRGSFETDPFRAVMIADAMGAGVASKVLFSTNHKKRQIFKDGEEVGGKGPAARRECIIGGQFAALSSEVRLASLPGSHPPDKVPKSLLRWQDLAIACNRYYEPRLHKELALLDDRCFCDPTWSSQLNTLLQALGPALKAGDCFLLRVGRHSGAENVTLDGVRDIRIMQGRGMPPRTADAATTLWLAAEHENATRGALLPFGWVLVERADTRAPDALREWCLQQPRPDMAAIQARLDQAREAAAAVARAEAARAAERQQAERLRLEEAAREAQADAKRTPNEREVRALAQALQDRAASLKGGRDKANTELHARARRLAQRALQEDWTPAERQLLAEVLEAELPRVVALDWRDERKKLRIAALRGTS